MVAPCNLKNTQTLAKGRSRIDNTRRMVQRRRQHTGLEPSEAGPDASGPAAVEDARGAVAVARREEPPRFPMDGFVGGGLRLALVSRASTACRSVKCDCGGWWRRGKGRDSRHFLAYSRHFQAVVLCLAPSQVQIGRTGLFGLKYFFFERPIGPWEFRGSMFVNRVGSLVFLKRKMI